MMSVSEYAKDVNKSLEEVLNLCQKLGIKYTDSDSMLTEDDIVVLDNAIASDVDFDVSDEVRAYYEEEDMLDLKVEKILTNVSIDLDSENKPEKLKSKSDRQEKSKSVFVAKNNFQKEKKNIYKHREKLKTNDDDKENVVLYKKGMTVSELAKELNVASSELIKKLMKLGVISNVNYSLNYETAELLVVDYDKVLKKEEEKDISNFESYEIIDKEEDLEERPPVVTVMGHVDHGKTSLLDKIRSTDVASGEAGGITQAIGAYQVDYNGRKITFVDTPGHEAFTEMRARGASITDVVIIVVAADDGVMPQTKEAIDHAKAAGVPIIVAINKMDKPGADPDRVMTELAEYGLTPEKWGGDVIMNNISAKTGEGIPELLESVLLISDMAELKANPKRYAVGTVVEASLDKHVGVLATILVQNGTLRIGDPVVVGTSYGKVRTLKNDKFQDIVEAYPSMPVEITGLNVCPSAGDKFMAFETEKQAKLVSEQRKIRAKEEDTNKSGMSLEDLFGAVKQGLKEVNIVVKADVNGSLEAVKQSLSKISVEGTKINVIRGGVGTITESDVVLASASNAIIVGFNVRPSNQVVEFAKDHGVDVKLYDIIYKMIEDIESSMKGLLAPIYEEKVLGNAEVRRLFKFSKVGTIAGSHVTSGIIKNNSLCRLIRDGVVIYTGKINSIQHEKDQIKEAKKDMDCGITLDNYNDIKEQDVIESYELVEVKR